MKNPFDGHISNPDNKNFNDIVSLNDNGDSLIKSLNLDKLKATEKGHSEGHTKIYGNSPLEKFKEKMSHVDMFIGGYDKEYGQDYKNYPLIDLGTDGNPFISILAQNLGVKGVIAVDLQNQIERELLNSLKDSPEYVDKNFPLVGLKMDMLEFLKQIPDNSCNVSMFSVDSFIIKSDSYALELLKELNRVVPEEGMLISFASIVDVQDKKYSQFFKKAYALFFKKNNTLI